MQEKEGEAGFLLTNKRGDYLLSFPSDHTSYQGFCMLNPHAMDYYKYVDAIRFDQEFSHMKHKGHEVSFLGKDCEVQFALVSHGLILSTKNYAGMLTLDFDMRLIHDFDDKGRIYEIRKEDGFIVIAYTKYEDDSLARIAHKAYVVIRGKVRHEVRALWKQKAYSYDKERGARDVSYVYEGLQLFPMGDATIIVACDENLTKAKVKALYLEKNSDEERMKLFLHERKAKDLPLSCALSSLGSLTIHPDHSTFGMLAGLPWFFQFWTRDELISSVYYLITQRFKTMKDLLMNYLSLLGPDGRLPNRRPHADLGSCDATGWLCKRFLDLFLLLEEKRELSSHFHDEELRQVYAKLSQAVLFLNRSYAKDVLVENRPKETWMDTDFGGDVRDGARIEIQALHLASYRCLIFLGKKLGEDVSGFAFLENRLKKRVRELFFDGKCLADGYVRGSQDWTLRPNIFIAYYAYPDLLAKGEWKAAFSHALQKLWLSWGGLATIDKNHPLFCSEYTGMTNQSYHRGDSWFFVNNMAALCMLDLDAKAFKEYIAKIWEASAYELMYSGLAGHHAEVSSASHLSSKGCLAQAWSAALFAEFSWRSRF